MNTVLPNSMLQATRLVREGRLGEASTLLQHFLRGGEPPADAPAAHGTTGEARGQPRRVIDIDPETGETPDPMAAARRPAAAGMGKARMPQALQGLLDQFNQGGLASGLSSRPAVPVPDGARFLAGSYSSDAGSRGYKLFIPSGYAGEAVPLVVMLHGCTQSPDDFAAGTQMNALAEEQACLIVYPGQTSSANAQKCWNWFSPGDQQRDQGEPALIAGITRQVMRDYAVDPGRVYIAGLSAGGAAAAIMAQSYPDLYAAAGVHSGLACGAARDVPSAFAAMRNGAAPQQPIRAGAAGGSPRIVPTIVFHGDKDGTVHPRNGDQVIAQFAMAGTRRAEPQRGQVPGGHTYSRTIHTDAAGKPLHEHWLVHGGGHAWYGGSAAGSYTDPRGPNASREMLRFFLEHPRGITTP
ncbi:extracellular catalytic domain type 1 short-chain-length polyhydroxyalkanoate depolymerase [Roseomonas marmotae]|uniref:PHB depolymerase family esterase n=1 Tax=Roseomonas marmotae TaxID=2768161 RepID=A0ABS3KEN7_9PROT|nr:PHB depolymerase family esterase [Roseomonas marmotae]MBO1075910.1 PHB depolymerase family esterase [Roseomonas marmotae]QTI81907.1 PHB depolymerase family esterase [Roseomonas marmotae]